MSNKKDVAVTGKISIEEFNLLNKKIEENPLLNKSNIVSQAVSDYLHGTPATDPEQQKTIENLKKQLAEFSEKNNNLQNKVEELTNTIANQPAADPEALKAIESLKTENENLKTEVEKLKTQPPKGFKLSKNQLLINVPDTLQPFLTEVSNRETNRTGHKVTPDMILLNLFWAQVSKGPGDHLPMTFSVGEIRRRLEIVKQNQKPAS